MELRLEEDRLACSSEKFERRIVHIDYNNVRYSSSDAQLCRKAGHDNITEFYIHV